jgi:hypothetical protein
MTTARSYELDDHHTTLQAPDAHVMFIRLILVWLGIFLSVVGWLRYFQVITW